jgi:hypothetical protein
MDHKGHPTAAEIFKAVNRTDPRSSRATTYNNLRDLVKAGLVREVAVEGRAGRFDLPLRVFLVVASLEHVAGPSEAVRARAIDIRPAMEGAVVGSLRGDRRHAGCECRHRASCKRRL